MQFGMLRRSMIFSMTVSLAVPVRAIIGTFGYVARRRSSRAYYMIFNLKMKSEGRGYYSPIHGNLCPR